MKIEFTVYGKPEPQGSSRAFMVKGRPIITSSNKNLKSWRQELSKAAIAAFTEANNGKYVFAIGSRIPFEVRLQFFFKPPQKNKLNQKTTRPDVDKLMRAVLDGMSGIVYEDDCQVAHAQISKCFGVPERVEIYVGTME